jgi:hypothetical protein
MPPGRPSLRCSWPRRSAHPSSWRNRPYLPSGPAECGGDLEDLARRTGRVAAVASFRQPVSQGIGGRRERVIARMAAPQQARAGAECPTLPGESFPRAACFPQTRDCRPCLELERPGTAVFAGKARTRTSTRPSESAMPSTTKAGSRPPLRAPCARAGRAGAAHGRACPRPAGPYPWCARHCRRRAWRPARRPFPRSPGCLAGAAAPATAPSRPPGTAGHDAAGRNRRGSRDPNAPAGRLPAALPRQGTGAGCHGRAPVAARAGLDGAQLRLRPCDGAEDLVGVGDPAIAGVEAAYAQNGRDADGDQHQERQHERRQAEATGGWTIRGHVARQGGAGCAHGHASTSDHAGCRVPMAAARAETGAPGLPHQGPNGGGCCAAVGFPVPRTSRARGLRIRFRVRRTQCLPARGR